MAEGADAHRRAQRGVGQHQIDPVQGQFGQQAVGFVLAADHLYPFGQGQGRLQQAVGDQFGHHVGDTHRQAQGPADGSVAQVAHQFAAQREDLVRVTVHHAPHLGQHQPPPLAGEELLPQGFLQGAQLPADRGL